MRFRRGYGSVVLVACFAASPAWAVAPHASHTTATGEPRPELELYDPGATSPVSASARGALVWDTAPRLVSGAWARFQTEFGHDWRASFDSSRRAPTRMFGPGPYVAGSVSDPAIAEAHARAVLANHLELLAPGSSASDFELVANDLDAEIRSIGFVQMRGGLRVLGGQVSFRYKNDRLYVIGSEAVANVPDLSAGPTTGPTMSASAIEAAAVSWITEDFGSARAEPAGPSKILAYRDAGNRARFARVREVDVTTLEEIGKYRVTVEAATGRPVTRRSLYHFASAPLSLRVPTRAPSFGSRENLPPRFADINVEGAAAQSSADGVVTWANGTSTELELFLTGLSATVQNDAGPTATLLATLSDGVPFVWDQSTITEVDAQLTTFIHAERVRTFAKGFAPNLGFLDVPVDATVNIDDQCNAFSDGVTINFYQAGGGCENTGRIADVIYHEYGHSIHANAIINGVGAFEGAVSEGVSDYLAATMTGDPGTARGFFLSSAPLRHIDPQSGEARWPDDLVGEVHEDGLIIAGTLWDLRKTLIDKLGESEGAEKANELYYQGIRRAVDMPSMYVEVLAADDDDGDLTNGTPNVCEINEVFGLHGLRPPVSTTSPSLGVVSLELDGYDVSVLVQGLFEECPGETIAAASLSYRDRAGGPTETISMTKEGALLTASIPAAPANTVLKYSVEVDLGSSTTTFPVNAADPEYELFVGTPIPLYCTDFESDPEADGWTHGLLEGEESEGADDWAWSEPNGTNQNGDPPLAFSGDKAFGNDLSIEENFNGLYQADKVNFASSPVVELQGYDNIHLQYRRWLNVEDAQFDRASILLGDTTVWENIEGPNDDTHHLDREWRFHDVDLSELLKGQSTAQLHFLLASDSGLEFGGWTIDDVCIVALESPPPGPCENGSGGGCEGTGGAGGGDGGSGSDTTDDDDGCDCSTPARPLRSHAFLALGLLGLTALRRRRRR